MGGLGRGEERSTEAVKLSGQEREEEGLCWAPGRSIDPVTQGRSSCWLCVCVRVCVLERVPLLSQHVNTFDLRHSPSRSRDEFNEEEDTHTHPYTHTLFLPPFPQALLRRRSDQNS